MKRKLTELETKFASNNLVTLKDELEYLKKVEIPRIQLILDTAEIAVKKQIREKEQELKVGNTNLEELENAVKVLEDQIQNGVEQKEESK